MSTRNGVMDRAGAAEGIRIKEKRPDRGPGSAWCDTSGAYSPSASAISSSCVPRWTTRPPARTMISSQSRIVREPVGDDQAGTAAPPQVVVDDPLRSWDQRAGGLVEDQQAGVAHQGPGDLEPLPLAAGEIPSLLGHACVVAAASLEQVAMDRRVDRRPGSAGRDGTISSQRVRLSRTVPSKRQMSASTSSTELTKTSRGISASGLAVVEDLAAPGLVQPGGQPADRRFAAPRAADQGDALARPGNEREILDQRFLDSPVVTERDVAKLDMAAQAGASSAPSATAWTIVPDSSQPAIVRRPGRSVGCGRRRSGRGRPAAPGPRCRAAPGRETAD